MKKSIKILLILLLICPMVILSACTSPAQYLITALPSDSNLGTIQGAFNNEKLSEGTQINLLAVEKQSTAFTNPFICWIKDYKTVVSTNNQLSLTYNSENAGNYTAVFSETSQSKMMFASINKINFSLENMTTINYEIQYARINSGSSNFASLEIGSYANIEEYFTSNKNVVYFGSAGSNYEYMIKVNLNMQQSSGAETEYSVTFTTILNKDLFNSNGTALLTENLNIFDVQTQITITFQKLNSTMYNN